MPLPDAERRFPLLIAAAVCLVYLNSLWTPFQYDDSVAIVENYRIRSLWPPWRTMGTTLPGTPVDGRPLVGLSLAANCAVEGVPKPPAMPVGYHLFNLGVHVAAALALYGLARSTLALPGVRAGTGLPPEGGALAIALLWALHPLQTESVTYISQRAESMMGMFYLLTLYCFARGATDEPRTPNPGTRNPWPALSVAACALGMLSKEVMVTAPLAVWLYDRAFLSGSFREALRRRPGFYAALAGSWLALAGALAAKGYPVAEDGKFYGAGGLEASLSYLATQAGVIVWYLRLAAWPDSLCIDYAWPAARSPGDWLLPGLALLAALALSVRSLAARPGIGFLGIWLFLALAPTSSVLPIKDAAFEHRMYLPLAPLAALAVAGGWRLAGRLLPASRTQAARASAVAACLALGALTVRRNLDYANFHALWSDVLAKRPTNPRGHVNVGDALFKRWKESRNKGREEPGLLDRAEAYFREAERLDPRDVHALRNLGVVAHHRRRDAEAAEWFAKTVAADPRDWKGYYYLGYLMEQEGRFEQAAAAYDAVLRVEPDHPEVPARLAEMRRILADPAEAERRMREAAASAGSPASAKFRLADLLRRQGRMEEAAAALSEAVALDPLYEEAWGNLGNALAELGRHDEAVEAYRKAVEVRPDYHLARRNLALELEKRGKAALAAAEYREILRREPAAPDPALRLAWILSTSEDPAIRDGAEAVRLAEGASLGEGAASWFCQDTLAAAYAEAGRYAEASAAALKAAAFAEREGRRDQAESIRRRGRLYGEGKPYRGGR